MNPKGESRRWDRYNVVPSATSEIEVFNDIDGDGKPDILFAGPGAAMAYAKPDPANPTRLGRSTPSRSRGSAARTAWASATSMATVAWTS